MSAGAARAGWGWVIGAVLVTGAGFWVMGLAVIGAVMGEGAGAGAEADTTATAGTARGAAGFAGAGAGALGAGDRGISMKSLLEPGAGSLVFLSTSSMKTLSRIQPTSRMRKKAGMSMIMPTNWWAKPS